MEKVRFGLIGFGAWGSHHARAIAECEQAQLVAIAVGSPAHVAQAVRGKGAVPATREDGLWSVKMCLKAQESVDRGCGVLL